MADEAHELAVLYLEVDVLAKYTERLLATSGALR